MLNIGIMEAKNFTSDPRIVTNVHRGIGRLRNTLLVYGYGFLVKNFDSWKDWFYAGDIDFDMFRNGIALELGIALKELSQDLQNACYDRNLQTEKKMRESIRLISILL